MIKRLSYRIASLLRPHLGMIGAGACVLFVVAIAVAALMAPTPGKFEDRFGVRPEGARAHEALQAHVEKQLREDWCKVVLAEASVRDCRLHPVLNQSGVNIQVDVAAAEEREIAVRNYEETAWLARSYRFEVPNPGPVGFRI